MSQRTILIEDVRAVVRICQNMLTILHPTAEEFILSNMLNAYIESVEDVVELATYLYAAVRTETFRAKPAFQRLSSASEIILLRVFEQATGSPPDSLAILQMGRATTRFLDEEIVAGTNEMLLAYLNNYEAQERLLDPDKATDVVTGDPILPGDEYLLCDRGHAFLRTTIRANCESQIRTPINPTRCYRCPLCREPLSLSVYLSQ